METIRRAILETKLGNITIGFSYGICDIDPDSDLSPDDIFGKADKEMYFDKNGKEIRKNLIAIKN